MTGHLTPRAAERRFYLLTATRWLPVGVVVSIKLVATVLGTDAGAYAAVGAQSPAPARHPLELLPPAAAGVPPA